MKKLIPFLLAIFLLTGCSPATVELPTSTPIPPTATPLPPTATVVPIIMSSPTITSTPSFVSPTPYSEVSKCTFFNGELVLPNGERQYAKYFGWTSTGEYYIGADFYERVVFCFLKQGFTGTIREFDRQTDYYAEDVPEQVLDSIDKEGLLQVIPAPDGRHYIFMKLSEPPLTRNMRIFDIWLWDDKNQKASILFDVDEHLWNDGLDIFPPEKIQWLDDNLLFGNCETGDDPSYFFIDIQRREFTWLADGECYFNEFFRGFVFSPNGKKHLSVRLDGDFRNYGINPLLIAQTNDTLQYYQRCTDMGDRYAGLDEFMRQTIQIPFVVKTVYLLNSGIPSVHWSKDSNSLYLIDINSDHSTYGDILKYDVESGKTETIIEFKNLDKIFPEIPENWYQFSIAPSEEYVLIVNPWNEFHILPIADLN